MNVFTKMIICGGLLVSSSAFAGAWNSDKDKGLAILQYRHQDRTDKDLNEATLYGQYGLTDKITAGLISDNSLNDTANNEGLINTQSLFLQPQIWKSEKSVGSVMLSLGSSTQSNSSGGQDNYGFYEVRAQYGYSFNESYFIDLQLAQKEYFNGPNSELRSDNTLGYKFAENKEIYLQNFNCWTKDFDSHEIQGIFSSPIKTQSPHRLYGGVSVPWGSPGIQTSLILVLGYRLDFGKSAQ